MTDEDRLMLFLETVPEFNAMAEAFYQILKDGQCSDEILEQATKTLENMHNKSGKLIDCIRLTQESRRQRVTQNCRGEVAIIAL
jgi:hypothetical protein